MSCPSSSTSSSATASGSSHAPKSTKSRSKASQSKSGHSEVSSSHPTVSGQHPLNVPQSPTGRSWCSPSASNEDSSTAYPVSRNPDSPRNDDEVNRLLSDNIDIVKIGDPMFGGLLETLVENEKHLNLVTDRGVSRALEWCVRRTYTFSKIRVQISHIRRPVLHWHSFLHLNVCFLPLDTDVVLDISEFIDRVEVWFEGEQLLPPTYWVPANSPGSSGFTVPRHIHKPSTACVFIFAKNGRFTTTPEFGRLIGVIDGTLDEIRDALYLYAHNQKIIDHEKKVINCDTRLEALFGKQVLNIGTLLDDICMLLQPEGPLPLTYDIDDKFENGKFFEISLPSVTTVDAARNNVIFGHSKLHDDIEPLNTKLVKLMKKLKKSNAKREFYDAVAKDPRQYMSDLPNAFFEHNVDTVATRTNPNNYPSSFFANEDVLQPAVAHYLTNKTGQKKLELQVATMTLNK